VEEYAINSHKNLISDCSSCCKMKFLKDITPREYQQKIFETCKDKNCLVVIPTGLGKTLIALMLTIERMTQFPSEKVVFLAPTKPLIEQHFKYFQKHLPELFAQMELFTGKVPAGQRKKLWQSADIIFSTPQCVGNDLKNNLYNLKEVSLLIEDESHRCLKNYSYTYIVQEYHKQAQNIRVLGLTASPGSDKEKIQQICKNLGVTSIEARTRESEDVKHYLQELKFNTIQIEFPDKFKEIRDLLLIIYNKKTEELKNRKLLFFHATKVSLLELQGRIMHSISTGNKNFNLLVGASVCAQAIKIQHAIELLETQTLYSFNSYIQELFKQAEQGKSKAVQHLVKTPEFNQAYTKTIELIAKKIEHPKLLELKSLTEYKFSKNPKAKIIIFAQYRNTTVQICKELNSIPGVRAKVFVGQAKRGEGETATGLNQKEQQEIVRQFSLGEINILVATSIGEEGLDIPEVNAVIFYEPIPSAIRKIQRAGRTARSIPGELDILVTKATRDEAYYWAAFHKEKKMHSALNSIKEEMENGTFNLEENKNKSSEEIPEKNQKGNLKKEKTKGEKQKKLF